MNKRHEAIKKIIADEVISTQQELVDALVRDGFDVTQATISRDIKQLNIRKHNTGGVSRYVCVDKKDVPMHFVNVLKEGFISSDVAVNILVIKTVPGMAMAVAAALDAFQFPDLVGCIAGDDTIMCAIRDAEAARELRKTIDEMLKI